MDKKKKYFELVIEIKKDLEKFTVFLTRNKEASKELICEAILQGYDSYDKLKKTESFKSYMMTICYRLYLKSLKSKKDFILFDETSLKEFYNNNTDNLYDLSLLYQSIEKLNKKEKTALILFELMGYNQKEVSSIMNISVSNVKILVFRAKKKLKQMLVE